MPSGVADSLPSSKFLLSCRIEESDCQSIAETQSFIDKSVGEWRVVVWSARHFCTVIVICIRQDEEGLGEQAH